jgi:small multidrug resistance family-3 protein
VELLRVSALFAVTALAEIIGCYLPWLVIRHDKSPLLLFPAAAALALFTWLLTLHPAAAGRTYAAYGGMYIVAALIWLRVVLGGMAVIALQPSAS